MDKTPVCRAIKPTSPVHGPDEGTFVGGRSKGFETYRSDSLSVSIDPKTLNVYCSCLI